MARSANGTSPGAAVSGSRTRRGTMRVDVGASSVAAAACATMWAHPSLQLVVGHVPTPASLGDGASSPSQAFTHRACPMMTACSTVPQLMPGRSNHATGHNTNSLRLQEINGVADLHKNQTRGVRRGVIEIGDRQPNLFTGWKLQGVIVTQRRHWQRRQKWLADSSYLVCSEENLADTSA